MQDNWARENPELALQRTRAQEKLRLRMQEARAEFYFGEAKGLGWYNQTKEAQEMIEMKVTEVTENSEGRRVTLQARIGEDTYFTATFAGPLSPLAEAHYGDHVEVTLGHLRKRKGVDDD